MYKCGIITPFRGRLVFWIDIHRIWDNPLLPVFYDSARFFL
jgi:hypothetical protein